LPSYELYRRAAPRTQAGLRPTVLFFGRVSPYKGLDDLYRAAPLIAQQVPGLHIVVAGRPYPGYALPRAPALPNDGCVEVIDRYVSNAELAILFERAHLVVCPYVDATQSGVIMTAFAFDRPVVA